MSRTPGAVGKHRRRADIVFAQHNADPLEELIRLAKDSSLSIERKIQIWQALMPFLYPKLRSIVIEEARITFEDIMALPPDQLSEIAARAQEHAEELIKFKKNRYRGDRKLPLPTGPRDLDRYRDLE